MEHVRRASVLAVLLAACGSAPAVVAPPEPPAAPRPPPPKSWPTLLVLATPPRQTEGAELRLVRGAEIFGAPTLARGSTGAELAVHAATGRFVLLTQSDAPGRKGRVSLVFGDLQRGVVARNDGDPACVIPRCFEKNPAFSPDGNTVYVFEHLPARSRVHAYAFGDPAPSTVVYDRPSCTFNAWSADMASALCVTGALYQPSELKAHTPPGTLFIDEFPPRAGSAPRRAGQLTGLAWQHGLIVGDQIFVRRYDGAGRHLEVYGAGQAAPRRLYDYRDPFPADHSNLIWDRARRRVITVDAAPAGEERHRIVAVGQSGAAEVLAETAEPFAFSDDFRWLVYAVTAPDRGTGHWSTDLMIKDLDDGSERTVTAGRAWVSQVAVLSPR